MSQEQEESPAGPVMNAQEVESPEQPTLGGEVMGTAEGEESPEQPGEYEHQEQEEVFDDN